MTGVCPANQLKYQGNGIDTVCEGVADMDEHYVVNGKLLRKPESPSPNHSFDYAKGCWVDSRTSEQLAQEARSKRDNLLAACDWRVTAATERGETPDANWQAYRQALRDISKQPGFPANIVWPQEP